MVGFLGFLGVMGTFFQRREWMVLENHILEKTCLFGKCSERRFVDGAIIIERDTTPAHLSSVRRAIYLLHVEFPNGRHTLWRWSGNTTGNGAEQARAVGRFLAQRTGWPLDNRLGQWNVA